MTEKCVQLVKGAESEIGVKRRKEDDGDSCASQFTGNDSSSVSKNEVETVKKSLKEQKHHSRR